MNRVKRLESDKRKMMVALYEQGLSIQDIAHAMKTTKEWVEIKLKEWGKWKR